MNTKLLTLTELERQSLIFEALDQACLAIQNALNIEDGFNASMYFQDRELDRFLDLMEGYIDFEIEEGKKEALKQFSEAIKKVSDYQRF
jgi:HD superfamily phosphodiesterase